ncbi:hypothetical protein [Mangrovibacterium marinum]|uniref:Uncharacterized protein n=1 Tax=Mangrovibacterium marinum TaxID=1639118 RepID=A0A2T5C0B0_9BACT|nr:hypothetical protein [Mangrovibacterium marinum]PTN08010.1 hypothetical protein C8N47_11150 [Mangrovibacterium marinum]
MNSLKNITKLEYLFFFLLFAASAYGIYLAFTDMDAFLVFTQEDGMVENLTSLFLFAASGVCIYRLIQYKKAQKPGLWLLTAAVLALLFFFAGGEEISWGQRIFGIQSGEFFLEHNKQAETNLHNLIVGGTNINKLIFSQILFVVMVIYFLFARLLVNKIPFIARLEQQFNVPLPKIQHAVVMIVVAGSLALIPNAKNAELLEMSFAFIFFLIFLNPAKVEQ